MTPIQITDVVNAILELREKDRKMQQASDIYHDELYPDCHNPFLIGVTDGAMGVLELMNPEMAEWISYFVYEVPGLKRNDPDYDVIVKYGGTDYHMNDKQDLITFLCHACA